MPLQRRHGDNRAHGSHLPHYGFPTLTYSQSIPHQCLFLKATEAERYSIECEHILMQLFVNYMIFLFFIQV